MTTFNLIPAAYVARLHERAVVRWWMVGAGGAGVLLAAVAVVSTATSPRDTDRIADRIVEASVRAEAATKQTTRWRIEAARSARELAARRAVGEHPDWSLLLTRLAADLGDSIVLEKCDLTMALIAPPPAKAGEALGASVKRYTIDVAGLGPTQSQVLRFVSAIEGWKVFDKVTLEESKSRAVGAVEGLSFRVRLRLDDGGAGK